MLKRNFTLFAIIALIVVIGIVVWGLQQHQKYEPGQTLRAVPVEASIVVRVNHSDKLLKRLNRQIEFKEELLNFESLQTFYKTIGYLDSAAFFTRGPGKGLINEPFYLSFHKMGKNRIEWTAHFALNDKSHRRALTAWLDKLKTTQRNYTGYDIFEILPQEQMPAHLFASFQEGVLSVSSSSLLVETVIRQQQAEISLLDQTLFKRVEKTTDNNAQGSVFINFDNLPAFLEPFFASASHQVLPFWKHVARWGVVDFDVKTDGLRLNGFLTDEGSDESFVSVFDGVGVRRSQLPEVLPSNTRFLLSYNFANGAVFTRNFSQFLSHSEDAPALKTLEQRYKQANGTSFMDDFMGMTEGELALAFTDHNPSETGEGHYLVIRTIGQDRSREVMNKMQKYFGVAVSPVSYYQVDEATRFPIYRGITSNLSRGVLGHLFPEVPMGYFAFYRNYLIFANSIKSLEAFLYDNALKRTLNSHAYYSAFTENFSFQENLFMFAEIPHLYSFLGEHLNKSVFHPTEIQNKALGNFYGLGVQLSTASDLKYATIYLSHAPHRDKEPRTIWQSRLDSAVSIKPVLVYNHDSGDKEIMVQDNANHLYLMNNLGRVLWKKTLDGPIISEIYQIDYYRNNKLQYLFNTRNKLYLLDRNGNHVAKYPFPLASPATNGLSVFDYDNSRNYRIFLALSDRRVYLFDKTGNRVPGWEIPQTEGTVTQPVQFFRTSGRDYIVFSDQYRNYLLDRRGAQRVEPQKDFIRHPGNLFYLEYPNSDDAALVTTSREGMLAKIYLPSGRTSLKKSVEVPQEHFFGTTTGNKPKYVFTSELQMQILETNSNKKVTIDFPKPMNVHTDFYQFSADDLKLGVVSKDGAGIYLYNSNGSLYKGFPLKGTSRFSIGFLKSSAYRFNLVTGGDNNYLYNYRVE